MEWSGRYHLFVDMSKTKEMLLVSNVKKRTVTKPITIMCEEAETVDHQRHQGVHLNDRLDLRTKSDAVRKGVSRRYFLRKLRFFSVCSKKLEIFYHPVVVSVIYFAVVYFAGGQHQCQRCPHDQQLIHKARTIAGQNVRVSESVRDGRSMTNCCPPWTTHHTSCPLQRQQSSFPFGVIQPATIKTTSGNHSYYSLQNSITIPVLGR